MLKQSTLGTPQKEISKLGQTGVERRNQLVIAAYHIIAEKGFEGLRTREVADIVGINHATLHYYFPSKEDLIQGVVDYLIEQFSSTHTPQQFFDYSAQDLLRAEFAYINQIHNQPEMFIVLNELSLRAMRDEAIAKLLNVMDNGWHSYLRNILQNGIKSKMYRSDLDVELCASIIMTIIKGIRSETLRKTQKEIEQISASLLEQIEGWLTI
jgi:AcrR family transcriptional regulator